MRPSFHGWTYALVLTCATALTACGGSSPPAPSGCTPTCRSGFTCVSGNCVSACNPACGPTETCVVQSTGATACMPGGAPDGSTDDIADATSPPGDAPPTSDIVTPPGDGDLPDASQPPPDGVTPPTDNGLPPADVPVRPPCGMTGQPCCSSACVGNNVCNQTSMRCEAFTPDPDECTSTATCPAGRICALADACAGGTRACLKCIVAPMGLPAGAACGGTAGFCSTGICANRLCTVTCVPGAAGDEACRRFNPQTLCSELSPQYITRSGPATTFGACLPACHRDADCTSPARCGLAQQRVADTYVETCRAPFGTLAAGATCPLTPMLADGGLDDPMMYCQSSQCFSVATSTTSGYCSAFCATDADCPGPTYACHDIPFFRPSGVAGTTPIRMCERR